VRSPITPSRRGTTAAARLAAIHGKRRPGAGPWSVTRTACSDFRATLTIAASRWACGPDSAGGAAEPGSTARPQPTARHRSRTWTCLTVAIAFQLIFTGSDRRLHQHRRHPAHPDGRARPLRGPARPLGGRGGHRLRRPARHRRARGPAAELPRACRADSGQPAAHRRRGRGRGAAQSRAGPPRRSRRCRPFRLPRMPAAVEA